MSKGFLIVDPQVDFVSGSLAVPYADEALEVCRWLMPHYDYVIASKDWHPMNHCSFEESGGPWPEHCVAQTIGSAFADYHFLDINECVYKGTDPDKEAYSAFDGKDFQGRSLHNRLARNVEAPSELHIGGLALDYCVKATALDAAKLGWDTTVNLHATAAVGPISDTLSELAAAGVKVKSPLMPRNRYVKVLKEGKNPGLR